MDIYLENGGKASINTEKIQVFQDMPGYLQNDFEVEPLQDYYSIEDMELVEAIDGFYLWDSYSHTNFGGWISSEYVDILEE